MQKVPVNNATVYVLKVLEQRWQGTPLTISEGLDELLAECHLSGMTSEDAAGEAIKYLLRFVDPTVQERLTKECDDLYSEVWKEYVGGESQRKRNRSEFARRAVELVQECTWNRIPPPESLADALAILLRTRKDTLAARQERGAKHEKDPEYMESAAQSIAPPTGVYDKASFLKRFTVSELARNMRRVSDQPATGANALEYDHASRSTARAYLDDPMLWQRVNQIRALKKLTGPSNP